MARAQPVDIAVALRPEAELEGDKLEQAQVGRWAGQTVLAQHQVLPAELVWTEAMALAA